jgi:hypothetical protein
MLSRPPKWKRVAFGKHIIRACFAHFPKRGTRRHAKHRVGIDMHHPWTLSSECGATQTCMSGRSHARSPGAKNQNPLRATAIAAEIKFVTDSTLWEMDSNYRFRARGLRFFRLRLSPHEPSLSARSCSAFLQSRVLEPQLFIEE